jgi:hypothetical protein
VIGQPDPDWFEAGCPGDCRKKHTRRPGYCTLVPPPEPAVSFLRTEDAPDGGRHIVTHSIPVTAWNQLITVAKWVSRGRSAAFLPDPGIAPAYPDAAARFALGALDDAGLLGPVPHSEICEQQRLCSRTGYPYQDGEVTVLGPQIFASSDGEVICWKSENYVRQDRITAALAHHQPIDGTGGPYCQTCTQDEEQPAPIGWWVPYPCPTVVTLTGQQKLEE